MTEFALSTLTHFATAALFDGSLFDAESMVRDQVMVVKMCSSCGVEPVTYGLDGEVWSDVGEICSNDLAAMYGDGDSADYALDSDPYDVDYPQW